MSTLARALVWVSLVAPVVACSSSETPGDAGGDASGEDAAADAPSDAPAESGFPSCDATKPFGAPALIAELSTAADDLFPRLTPDELTVYFERYNGPDAGSGGKGGSDLLVATRASATTPFGAATFLTSVNGPSNDFDPSVTGDDLTLFFSSTRTGGAGNTDLWVATRSDTSSDFGNVTDLASLDTADNEHTPYALPNGLTLYFTGTSGSAIERATRASPTDAFALDTSSVLAGVNTSGAEVAPVVSPDELTMYFASQRTGSQLLDVYVATRADASSAFGSVARVDAVDTAGNDAPGFVSPDGCRLYLHSDVAGSYDLYVATKP